MEEFEELKNIIINKVKNRELSEEIEKEIIKLYDEISEIYIWYNINNESIDMYIQGERNRVRGIIQKLNDNRNFKQLEDMNIILNNVQRRLEDNKENETLEEDNKKEITEIEMHRNEIVGNISDFLKDSLSSIQLTSNMTLERLGYEYSAIERIDDEVQQVINKISKCEEDILELLDEEDKELKDYIGKQYDEYEQYIKSKSMTKHQQFAKNLDVGISQEQQKDFSVSIVNKDEEINKQIQDEFRDK